MQIQKTCNEDFNELTVQFTDSYSICKYLVYSLYSPYLYIILQSANSTKRFVMKSSMETGEYVKDIGGWVDIDKCIDIADVCG